jgi:transposase-like protein
MRKVGIVGSSRGRFTAEYKAQAVALVTDSGRSIADAARGLGINGTTLGVWVKKARERGEVAESTLSVSERAELEKLRKDYAQAQMDIAFLKKGVPRTREAA